MLSWLPYNGQRGVGRVLNSRDPAAAAETGSPSQGILGSWEDAIRVWDHEGLFGGPFGLVLATVGARDRRRWRGRSWRETLPTIASQLGLREDPPPPGCFLCLEGLKKGAAPQISSSVFSGGRHPPTLRLVWIRIMQDTCSHFLCSVEGFSLFSGGRCPPVSDPHGKKILWAASRVWKV